MRDTIRDAIGIGALLALIGLAYFTGLRSGYDRGFDIGYTIGHDYGSGNDWGEYPADQYTIERERHRP